MYHISSLLVATTYCISQKIIQFSPQKRFALRNTSQMNLLKHKFIIKVVRAGGRRAIAFKLKKFGQIQHFSESGKKLFGKKSRH